MTDKPRREPGTGSVHYDKTRDRWVGTYEAGWTTRGTRRRRKVTAKTAAGARTKLATAIRNANQDDGATTGRLTVKRWADQWLDITTRDLRPTTWQANRSLITNWITPTIGHRRLDQLAPNHIRAVTKAITDAGRTPSTAARAHAVLLKMLRDARAEGHQVPQTAIDTKGASAGKSDRDTIPLADALAILEVASTLPERSRWVAAFLQGMRPAECLGLTWGCVDFDTGTIDVSWQLKPLPYKVPRDKSSGFRVPVGYEAHRLVDSYHRVRPKTAQGQRIIPLVPWMASALADWREVAPESRHGLVWPATGGGPRTDTADRAAWYALTDAAQVARVDENHQGRRYHLYEARHTAATLLREAGVDDTTIIAIMGHASILSTNAYLHTDITRTRAALDKVAARYGLTTG